MLIAPAIMFPLSVVISKLIKADWKLENNPLRNLGLLLNIAQLIYFPILIWAFIVNPEGAVLMFAIITGAHLFPYGWFYHAKAYYVMAPIISIGVFLLFLFLEDTFLFVIPLFMVEFLIVLVILLVADYRKKEGEMNDEI